MPTYVHAAGGAAGVALLAALVVPAPAWARRRASRACRALLVLGWLSLVAAVVLPLAFNAWFAGFAAIPLALALWMTMFWFARDDGRAEPPDGVDDEDDSGGGGGGGTKRPASPDPSGGGGLTIDWDAFDHDRKRWERNAPVRERVPATV